MQYVYVVPVEKLEPITESEWKDIDFYLDRGPSTDPGLIDGVKRYGGVWEDMLNRVVEIEKKYPHIDQFKKDYDFFVEANLEGTHDMHKGNIMKRLNGEFVMVDPLWEGETPYQAYDRAMKAEIGYDDYEDYEEPDYIKGGKKWKQPKKKPQPFHYKPVPDNDDTPFEEQLNEEGEQLKIDQKNGVGAVDDNQRVNYLGFEREMTPDEFLLLAAPIYKKPEGFDKYVDWIKQHGMASPFFNVKWDTEKQAWQIIGHEGRHRMNAVKKYFGPNTKIPVHIFPRDGLRARDINSTMAHAPLLPEKKRQDLNEGKGEPEFKTLKKNKKPLTDEERAEVMKSGATWNMGSGGKPSPAVWKAVVDGKTWYVTNTHRAYNVRPTLKGAISRYHKFIKTTA